MNRHIVLLAIAIAIAIALVGALALSACFPPLTCEGRTATRTGTAGADVITGTSGDDVIVGLDGDDTITSGVVLATTVGFVGALTPDYDDRAETVSRLGSPGQPLALLARSGLVLYGVMVLVGAGLLGRHAPGRERIVGALTALYGAAAVAAGWAPKDAPLAAHTLTSRVHVGATLVGGAAILFTMVLVARTSPLAATRRTAIVVAILSGVVTIIFTCAWGTPVYGTIERCLLALPALWLVGLAYELLPAERAPFIAPTAAAKMTGPVVRVGIGALVPLASTQAHRTGRLRRRAGTERGRQTTLRPSLRAPTCVRVVRSPSTEVGVWMHGIRSTKWSTSVGP